MSVTWRGMNEYRAKIRAVKAGMKDIEMAVRDAVFGTHREARIASPVDTGRLRASIQPEIATRDNIIQGVVGSNVEYAGYQEFGTRYIKPRRFLGGAFDRYKQSFIRAIQTVMQKLTRK